MTMQFAQLAGATAPEGTISPDEIIVVDQVRLDCSTRFVSV